MKKRLTILGLTFAFVFASLGGALALQPGQASARAGCVSQNVTKGWKGDCVKYIQAMLNGIYYKEGYGGGYNLNVDSDFGNNTYKNVLAFQSFITRHHSAFALSQDGQVGFNTWRELCRHAILKKINDVNGYTTDRSYSAALNAGCKSLNEEVNKLYTLYPYTPLFTPY